MKQKNAFIAIGLMLFALFFGAGNLIFPPFLGQNAGTHTVSAMIGFLVTGCGLPLLAVVAVCYSGKNLQDIASRVYPWYGIFMVAAVSLTIGPFFAIPRTGSTSFEMAVAPFVDATGQVPLLLYSLVFFALSWWLAISPSKLVDRVGKVLTPIMLILLLGLFLSYMISPMGAWQPPAIPKYADTALAFTSGIMEGYNTMDGLAGLLFGILVIDAVKETGVTEQKTIAWETFRAGLVAMLVMCVIYVFLGFIGASSVTVLGMKETGAPVLVGAMNYYFGAAGPIAMGIVVILACLTTSIGLLAAIATLFNKIMPSVSFRAWVTLFAAFSFGVANFGLAAIIKAAIPVLVFLYPLTVALIILTFLNGFYQGSPYVHRTATLFAFFPALYDGLSVAGLTPAPLNDFMSTLPLAGYGLAWLPIFAAGLLIGWILYAATGKKAAE